MAQGKVKWFSTVKPDDDSLLRFLIGWYGHKAGTTSSAAPESSSTNQASGPPASHVDPEIIGDVVGARGDGAAIQQHSIRSTGSPDL